MDEVRLVPLADIIEPRTLLRLVDKNTIEYLEMRDSVQRFGFTSSISVRPAKRAGKYEFIDGLHRYCIAKDLSLSDRLEAMSRRGVAPATHVRMARLVAPKSNLAYTKLERDFFAELKQKGIDVGETLGIRRDVLEMFGAVNVKLVHIATHGAFQEQR
jgi:hypothetical protein